MDKAFISDLQKFIEENKETELCLIRQLCSIPAPSFHEEKRAEFCKDKFEEYGAKGVYIDKVGNTVFPLNCDGKDGITVFSAHMDTAFPDIKAYPLKEDEEKIHCPGAVDNTASVAVILLLAKFFTENNIVPQNGLLLVCSTCEEKGDLKGVRNILNNYAGRIKRFISFDCTSLNTICNQCVGRYRYNVTVKTAGGHAYNEFGKESAVFRMAEIINKIYAIKTVNRTE